MSVQENINKILWDRRVITIPDDIECPKGIDYLIIRDLTLEDRNFYTIIRDLELAKARKDGVPSEGDIMANARLQGYWGQEEDDIEAKADDHIAYLESEFEAKKKFKSRQNIIKLQIEDAKAKKAWVERKRSEFRLASADYLAHEIASFKLLRRVVLTPDGELLFKDEQVFLNYKQEYIALLYFLVKEIMSEGLLETPDLRAIARSTEWRLIWTLARENLATIFNRPICDFTLNHKMLIYWSRIYDSAIESTEPPETSIIQDDAEFDIWLSNRHEQKKEISDKQPNHKEHGQILDGEYVEICTCGAKEKNKSRYLGEKLPHDNTCPFGTWHKYSPEERENKAKQVYGRNSTKIRNLLNSEQEKILQRGNIEEQHLRGKATRQLLGMPQKIIPIRRR